MSVYANIGRKLSTIDRLRKQLREDHRRLSRELTACMKRDPVNGTIYFRDGKYPYLNWMDGSRRHRQYIGLSPDALERAQDRLNAWSTMIRLKKELRDNEVAEGELLTDLCSAELAAKSNAVGQTIRRW